MNLFFYVCALFFCNRCYSAEQTIATAAENFPPIVIILPDSNWFQVPEQQYPSLRKIRGSLIANLNQVQANEEISILLPEAFRGIQPREIFNLFDIVTQLYAQSPLFSDKEFLEVIKNYLQQFGSLTTNQITQNLVNLKLLTLFFHYQEIVNKLNNLIILIDSPLSAKLSLLHMNSEGKSSLDILKKIIANHIITRNEFLEWPIVFATISKIRIISFIKNYSGIFNAMDDLKAVLAPIYEIEQIKKRGKGNLSNPLREKLAELQTQFERKVKEFTGYEHPTVEEYEQVIDIFLNIYKPHTYSSIVAYDQFKKLKDEARMLPNKQYTV